ncbi:MAG TPA: hypothetical protein VNS22_13515 [Geminicoccus sp.]|uniref:hypothetical protein n=1 Tax=Geminicoccus sp. TaxID=2024832 RepID=UPI002C993204|nr:hypothetical protein [Geminicoccus sp.]HWL69385.1 hypothetical protein [Geminicoccus sp.]
MLTLLHEAKAKKEAQSILFRNLTHALNREGKKNIGFPSGNVDEIVYSAGKGKLWCAFGKPSQEAAVPRYWTPFGIYDPDRPSQQIVVEINVPSDHNTAQVAGFFAQDSETGDIFLMHDGGVGGGRKGVGQTAFLVWSKAKLVDVIVDGGKVRRGIAVAKLDHPDLPERIWRFVKIVNRFKEAIRSGNLDSDAFRREIEEFDRYKKEFSGTKKGSNGGNFEYLTYHGDIVQKLYDERCKIAAPDEQVLNSSMIDLFVKKAGVITEIYEVKTGLGRQTLYTAIGQLMTHSAAGNGTPSKFLIVPDDAEIPGDFRLAIKYLGIEVRKFRLTGTNSEHQIELLG